jgi:hypothetical protein
VAQSARIVLKRARSYSSPNKPRKKTYYVSKLSAPNLPRQYASEETPRMWHPHVQEQSLARQKKHRPGQPLPTLIARLPLVHAAYAHAPPSVSPRRRRYTRRQKPAAALPYGAALPQPPAVYSTYPPARQGLQYQYPPAPPVGPKKENSGGRPQQQPGKYIAQRGSLAVPSLAWESPPREPPRNGAGPADGRGSARRDSGEGLRWMDPQEARRRLAEYLSSAGLLKGTSDRQLLLRQPPAPSSRDLDLILTAAGMATLGVARAVGNAIAHCSTLVMLNVSTGKKKLSLNCGGYCSALL